MRQPIHLRLLNLTGGLGALSVGVILLTGNANIFLRWLTGRQIPGAVELMVLLLPVTVFSALARAEHEGLNVRSTALVDRLSERRGLAVSLLGNLISIAMITLLILATGSRALSATRVKEVLTGVRELPLWPVRMLITIGFASFLLAVLGETARLARSWTRAGNSVGRSKGLIGSDGADR